MTSVPEGSARNVLVLMSDEHTASVMGAAGHVVSTPRLDDLAARGTRFRRAVTPSPICISARASLATGLAVHQHRFWTSADAYTGTPQSWMHRSRAAGARVESIGKLHFRSGADDHGFEAEHLPMYVTNEGEGWPQGLLRDPLPDFPSAAELADVGPGESDYVAYDRAIAARAAEWLAAPGDRPWVLFVSFVSPHYPLVAPPDHYARYADAPVPPRVPVTDDHPVLDACRDFWDYDRHFADDDHRDRAVRNYYGLVSFLDEQIGVVLDALDTSGQSDDTLVVYTSDHGDMLGDHGFWAKSVMYESAVAVPLILVGPGVPVGVNDTPVSLVDVATTIDVVSGDVAAESLLDFARSPRPDRTVVSEYHDGGTPTGMYLVRQDRWKAVFYGDGSPAQLFDHDADPSEVHDLASDPAHASLLAELRTALADVLDIDTVEAQARHDREARIAALGGRDAVLAMTEFNHTPLPRSG